MEQVVNSVVKALQLLPPAMTSPEAWVMLLAIGFQESGFKHRYQVLNNGGKGPARGFWQFEAGGGCKGVVTHAASRFWMHQVCQKLNVPFTAKDIWNNLETNDVLAAAAARLLLFTDPKKLPSIDDLEESWNLYNRVWRPGKPHPDRWKSSHWDGFSLYNKCCVLPQGLATRA